MSMTFSETLSIRQADHKVPFRVICLWVLPQVWTWIYPEIIPFLARIAAKYLGKILFSFPIVPIAEPLFYRTYSPLTEASEKGTQQRPIRGPTQACFNTVSDFSTLIFISGGSLLPYGQAFSWSGSYLSNTVHIHFSPILSINDTLFKAVRAAVGSGFSGLISATDSGYTHARTGVFYPAICALAADLKARVPAGVFRLAATVLFTSIRQLCSFTKRYSGIKKVFAVFHWSKSQPYSSAIDYFFPGSREIALCHSRLSSLTGCSISLFLASTLR